MANQVQQLMCFRSNYTSGLEDEEWETTKISNTQANKILKDKYYKKTQIASTRFMAKILSNLVKDRLGCSAFFFPL